MAQSKDTNWIPSGGVLAVAIACALVAAILVNVYVGHIEDRYKDSAKMFFRLKEDVPVNTPVQARNVEAVQIPKPILGAFENKAVPADETGQTILGKKAPRDLSKGEFLWLADFFGGIKDAQLAMVKPGFEIVSIPVESSLGQQLQPGGFVAIRGELETSTDPKLSSPRLFTVIKSVQVRSLGGSTLPLSEKSRSYDNIQLMVPSAVALQLQEATKLLKTKHFLISVMGTPEGAIPDPKLDPEALALVNRPRAAVGAPATSTGAPPTDAVPPPGTLPAIP